MERFIVAKGTCLVTLLTLCGVVASKNEPHGESFIHGHPLLGGDGARGLHLFGYKHKEKSSQEKYHHNPKFDFHFQEYHPEPHGKTHHFHTEYPYSQGYPHKQEYPQKNLYPYHDNYVQRDGYKVFFPPQSYFNSKGKHAYPSQIKISYGSSSSEESSSSSEESTRIKAVDKEIHVAKPGNKFLFTASRKQNQEQNQVIKIQHKVKKPEVIQAYEEIVHSEDEVVPETEPAPEPEAEETPYEVMNKDSKSEVGDDKDEKVLPIDDEDVTDDYSGYTHGYSGVAPLALTENFCVGQTDGNYANPGLTRRADPRCTYLTCSGDRTILFNCAPGTFNGRVLEYHTALWSRSLKDYSKVPHYRFESFGQDFCGALDVGSVTDGPVCTTSERKKPVVEEKESVKEGEENQPETEPEGEQEQAQAEISDIYNAEPDPEPAEEEYLPTPEEEPQTEVFPPEKRSLDILASDGPEVSELPERPEVPESPEEAEYSEGPEVPTEAVETDVPLSLPEGKAVVMGDLSLKSEDYSRYGHGYGGSPEGLDNDFCANMADGNYANPGLTLHVDPRCTYITCSSENTFIFSCPYGTFNGINYKHHYPLWGKKVESYIDAHHFLYGQTGFCSESDTLGVCRH